MEEICNSLDSCELCTRRGCHWLLKIGRCIWEGKGKVANEIWECDDGTTTTTPTHRPLNAARPVPGTVDRMVQTEEDQHLVLVIVLGISLGLVLLGGVALGVHLTLQRRLRQRNTSVSHTRLLEAMGYESDTLMSRIRRQLTPRPAPLTPPVIPAPPPPPQPATPLSSSSSSSSPSPNSTTAHSQFSTPSSFASPSAEARPSSSSTPLLHGRGSGQGTQTHYFDSTPEYPDDLEMVDLSPSPQQVHKSGYNLRSHKK